MSWNMMAETNNNISECSRSNADSLNKVQFTIHNNGYHFKTPKKQKKRRPVCFLPSKPLALHLRESFTLFSRLT
jgi:hypothetical protein